MTSKLNKGFDWQSFGFGYKICRNCGHINGEREDTIAFCNDLYKDNGGEKYIADLLVDYEQKKNVIYTPKAEFLIESLSFNKINEYKVDDIGCGAGHFVSSLADLGINATGYDISTSLVDFGNKQLKRKGNILKTVENEDELAEIVLNTNADVITCHYVLEHLRNPKLIFKNFKNSSAQYFYFSVPLLSLAIITESLWHNTAPRALGGAHTHLYTRNSIDYLLSQNDLEVFAEWHFGADAMDLHRSISIELKKNGASDFFTGTFQ